MRKQVGRFVLPSILIFTACTAFPNGTMPNFLLVVATPTAPNIPIENPTQIQTPALNTIPAPTRASPSATPISATSTPSPKVAAVISEQNANALAEIGQMKASYPSRLIWSLDGQSLGVVTDSGFAVFSGPTFQNPVTRQIKSPEVLLDVSPDLRSYASTRDQRSIDLIPISGGSPTRTLKPGTPLEGVNYSPDGNLVVVAQAEGIAVSLWDAQTGQIVKKLTGFQTAAPVYTARIAPDGKTLMWISRATIQFMDIASGKLGARFSHEDFVMDETVTPDGRTLVTAAEGTIVFWDIASGKKSKMSLATNPLTISLTPSGRVLAAASDKNVLLWDMIAQKQSRALMGHAARVTAVAFSRDGSLFASASEDGAVKVWGLK